MATLQELSIVSILVITSLFFLVLLIFGVMKSYKLKQENERLSNPAWSSADDNKKYKDFQEGHLYDTN